MQLHVKMFHVNMLTKLYRWIHGKIHLWFRFQSSYHIVGYFRGGNISQMPSGATLFMGKNFMNAWLLITYVLTYIAMLDLQGKSSQIELNLQNL